MESINCVIETPKGSGAKYNYDPKLGRMELSKVLPAGLVFPFDFGYIPGTIGEDGDPLDVIVLSEVPSFPSCAMKCRIIGGIKAMQQERNSEQMRNDRYLAVPAVSVLYKDISEVDQLPGQLMRELEAFFINYNEQAGKKFKPMELITAQKAIITIEGAQQDPKPAKLVQLLLPLNDPKGDPFPEKYFSAVEEALVKEFGGITTYVQSPAKGLWQNGQGKVEKDTLLVFEVMVSKIDRSFWKKFKDNVAKQFKQKELVIRQTEIGML